jgi:hypothetical protein
MGPISNGYGSKKSFQCQTSRSNLHEIIPLSIYCHSSFRLNVRLKKIMPHFGKEFVSEL